MPGTVRIIGGRMRGRRLRVADRQALRPTPDRVRETLFNWLAADLPGARCLDLFAGSGALGFEAASRGAAQVTMIERDASLSQRLAEVTAELGVSEVVSVTCADALGWLAGCGSRFDIVFVDPPYASGLVAPVLERLVHGGMVAPGLVYLEQRSDAAADLPVGWRVLRSKTAGEVGYHLIEVGPGSRQGAPGHRPASP